MIPTPILDELQALLDREELMRQRYKEEDGISDGGLAYGSYQDSCDNTKTFLREHAPLLITAARQLEEVRRDAERYRWLQREYTKQDRTARMVRPVVLYVNHSSTFIQNGDDLNAIIDAEMKKES